MIREQGLVIRISRKGFSVVDSGLRQNLPRLSSGFRRYDSRLVVQELGGEELGMCGCRD